MQEEWEPLTLLENDLRSRGFVRCRTACICFISQEVLQREVIFGEGLCVVKGKKQKLKQCCCNFAPLMQQVLVLKTGVEISGCKFEGEKYIFSLLLTVAGVLHVLQV